MKDLESIFRDSFVPVLEKWIKEYKKTRVERITPRYSQVSGSLFDDEVLLYSTQFHTDRGFYYTVKLDALDKRVVGRSQGCGELWGAWKKFRTEYLLENHKDISVF